ncbi:hypothetical protein [Sphingobacterium sp. LRF_L2]|uniref:hypothetical protein n=1 Tax=Sphingobacterium sp. LRF_L2 TaxID=3369421 RepID=UPI003F5E146F
MEELSGSDNCNVENVSYGSSIRPIMNISCAINGCHHASAILTFPLTTYSELKEQVDNGLLLKSINHEAGVSPMPKSVSKLSDCNIKKITAWIVDGALNN